MWARWHIISSLSEKVGGRDPRVPHIIAPMVVVTTYCRFHCCSSGMRHSMQVCTVKAGFPSCGDVGNRYGNETDLGKFLTLISESML